MEQFEQLLADEAKRQDFYARLRAFARCLHIALSSEKLYEVFSDEKVESFKQEWKQFSELKTVCPNSLSGDRRPQGV